MKLWPVELAITILEVPALNVRFVVVVAFQLLVLIVEAPRVKVRAVDPDIEKPTDQVTVFPLVLSVPAVNVN